MLYHLKSFDGDQDWFNATLIKAWKQLPCGTSEPGHTFPEVVWMLKTQPESFGLLRDVLEAFGPGRVATVARFRDHLSIQMERLRLPKGEKCTHEMETFICQPRLPQFRISPRSLHCGWWVTTIEPSRPFVGPPYEQPLWLPEIPSDPVLNYYLWTHAGPNLYTLVVRTHPMKPARLHAYFGVILGAATLPGYRDGFTADTMEVATMAHPERHRTLVEALTRLGIGGNLPSRMGIEPILRDLARWPINIFYKKIARLKGFKPWTSPYGSVYPVYGIVEYD